jgi:DNA-binding transcriptional ArsR family regulator
MVNNVEQLDRVFQALADPTRRTIVDALSRGSVSVSELAKPLPMSLPAVLQHVQVLEASGLIRSEKVGRVRTCHLDVKMLNTAEVWLEARRAMWHRRLDRLGAYLDRLPPEAPDDAAPRPSNRRDPS